MATAIEQQLQQMQALMQQMQGELQAMRIEVEQANTRATEADLRADEAENCAASTAVERLASGIGDGKGNGNCNFPTLVDTRGIGRPDNFGKGDQRTLECLFPGWRRKTSNYLVSVYPSIMSLLEWSQNEDKPLTETIVSDKAKELMGTDVANLEHIDQQIYLMLISLTDGTTNNLVANSNLGFDA